MQGQVANLITHADGRQFIRTGECDGCQRPGLHTGACCRFMVVPLPRRYSEDEMQWVRLHLGLECDGDSIMIESPCAALTTDGRCSLFGKPERPAMCQRYPEMPEQLVEGCIYQFEEVV